MANNTTLDPGTGGDVIATEDIAGVKYELVKLVDGTAAATTRIAAGTGLAAGSLRVNLATDVGLPAGSSNIGDVDVVTLPALPAGTNNIGDVDVLTLPALPTGTNNIGDVDVLTLPALPAGTNNIGDVDVLSLPALPAGTNNIGDVDVLSLPALPTGTNAVGRVGHDTTGLGHGVTTVTTAGTDVALAASTSCKWVIIQAQTDNTNYIAVGASGVDATIATGNGIMLSPGDSITITTDNLADISIDSLVNGEGVRYTYGT